jgi:Uma2 family endonuclease
MALPVEKESYTFADFLAWDEGDRIELIDGEAFMLSAPGRIHQAISGELFAQIHNYLKGKTCKVYAAPFAVRLLERDGDQPENVDTVVEPDISVICDPKKLDDYGCKGAPDLIIEILSPSTRRHDRLIKRNLYQRAGVREYWIVTPEEQSVQVLTLKDGFLVPHEEYGRNDMAKVTILDDCSIDLSAVFAEEQEGTP